MVRKSERYTWRLQRSIVKGRERVSTHDTDDEAKLEGAKWLQMPVSEVPWEESYGGTVIKAQVGAMSVEIQRFPVQGTRIPIQRQSR